MGGNGINDVSGMPFGQYDQARALSFVDDHRDRRQPPQFQLDARTEMLVRAVACAVRDARPNVTLPPHLFIPWRAQPWFVEARFILNGSSDATVASGASVAAAAEGISVVSETSAFSTDTNGTLTVPKGRVAVVRQWAAQPDDGGYFTPSGAELPVVRFRLAISDLPQINSPGLLGNHGDLDHPFDVSYVVPEGHTIAVEARSVDENMWHLIETFMTGYYIEVQDINDTLRGLVGAGTC